VSAERAPAAVLFGPNDFRIVEKPVPEPGPGEALVRVAMCGTCGTDLKVQTHPFPHQPPFGSFTPGHERTGTVVRTGPTVDELVVGAVHESGRSRGSVKRALSLAAQGKIRGRELVTHRYALDDIQDGFRVVRERDGDPIKVVFVP